MAAITSNNRAILTARSGAARCGASRCGFVPRSTNGSTPGSAGAYYMWTSQPGTQGYGPSTTWTVTRSA